MAPGVRTGGIPAMHLADAFSCKQWDPEPTWALMPLFLHSPVWGAAEGPPHRGHHLWAEGGGTSGEPLGSPGPLAAGRPDLGAGRLQTLLIQKREQRRRPGLSACRSQEQFPLPPGALRKPWGARKCSPRWAPQLPSSPRPPDSGCPSETAEGQELLSAEGGLISPTPASAETAVCFSLCFHFFVEEAWAQVASGCS